jgi:hypothetical protein
VRAILKPSEIAMSRRKKLTYLTQPEIERFMNAATELHRACCDPVIASSCDHSER